MSLRKESPTFPQFKLGILGGTFDHFHAGHKAFLKKGFQFSQKILIGLASKKFTKDKLLARVVLPFKKRKKELKAFLKAKGFLKRSKIVKIDTPFPPAIFNPKIECLLITKKTEENAKILNLERIKKNLPPLEIVKVPIVVNRQGECLSSEKIRLGKMDRNGQVFVETIFFKKTHFLPPNIRPLLKKPLGKLISGSEKNLEEAALKVKKRLKVFFPAFLVAVGDIVTLSLVGQGVVPDLSIIDFKVKRKEIYQDISELGLTLHLRVKQVENRAGTLNPELFLAIRDDFKSLLFQKKQLVIRVLGEEDLAALPAVLLAPLNSLVLYGQPEEGIVMIKITESKKKEIKRIVRLFKVFQAKEKK